MMHDIFDTIHYTAYDIYIYIYTHIYMCDTWAWTPNRFFCQPEWPSDAGGEGIFRQVGGNQQS